MIWISAIIRIVVCFLPQNNWTSEEGNRKLSVIRNAVFAVTGIGVILLYAISGNMYFLFKRLKINKFSQALIRLVHILISFFMLSIFKIVSIIVILIIQQYIKDKSIFNSLKNLPLKILYII